MTNTVREAVQIVLTRMETHPEDFYNDGRLHNYNTSRFGWVWNVVAAEGGYQYGLNEAEINALKQGYDKLMYRKFHDKVLESLLNEPETDEKMAQQGSSLKYNPYKYSDPRGIYGQQAIAEQQRSAQLSIAQAQATLHADSIKVGKQTITEALVQKLKNL